MQWHNLLAICLSVCLSVLSAFLSVYIWVCVCVCVSVSIWLLQVSSDICWRQKEKLIKHQNEVTGPTIYHREYIFDVFSISVISYVVHQFVRTAVVPWPLVISCLLWFAPLRCGTKDRSLTIGRSLGVNLLLIQNVSILLYSDHVSPSPQESIRERFLAMTNRPNFGAQCSDISGGTPREGLADFLW